MHYRPDAADPDRPGWGGEINEDVDADPALIGGNIVNAIGSDLATFGDLEVMHTHPLGLNPGDVVRDRRSCHPYDELHNFLRFRSRTNQQVSADYRRFHLPSQHRNGSEGLGSRLAPEKFVL